MTIKMTAKNQITIPKKISVILGLKKGSLFTIAILKNKIELIPLEIHEKTFTEEEYKILEALSEKEKGQERLITTKFIKKLKQGKL